MDIDQGFFWTTQDRTDTENVVTYVKLYPILTLHVMVTNLTFCTPIGDEMPSTERSISAAHPVTAHPIDDTGNIHANCDICCFPFDFHVGCLSCMFFYFRVGPVGVGSCNQWSFSLKEHKMIHALPRLTTAEQFININGATDLTNVRGFTPWRP